MSRNDSRWLAICSPCNRLPCCIAARRLNAAANAGNRHGERYYGALAAANLKTLDLILDSLRVEAVNEPQVVWTAAPSGRPLRPGGCQAARLPVWCQGECHGVCTVPVTVTVTVTAGPWHGQRSLRLADDDPSTSAPFRSRYRGAQAVTVTCSCYRAFKRRDFVTWCQALTATVGPAAELGGGAGRTLKVKDLEPPRRPGWLHRD